MSVLLHLVAFACLVLLKVAPMFAYPVPGAS